MEKINVYYLDERDTDYTVADMEEELALLSELDTPNYSE